MKRRALVKASLASVGGLAWASLPRLAALASATSTVNLTLQAPSSLEFHSPLPLTATVTNADGSPVQSGVVTFWALDKTATAQVPVVNGVAQATLILGSTLMLGTLTVYAQFAGLGLGTTLPVTAQVAIVPTTLIIVIGATVYLTYGALEAPVSATFTYPDGSPVEKGTANFRMDNVDSYTPTVHFVNGVASTLLTTYTSVHEPKPIPGGTHPYTVVMSPPYVLGSGLVIVTK